jgi:2-polyprenyl-6-hydroxyphenyl methylase/3-demethylubiquinone-9 3-methyltransferase
MWASGDYPKVATDLIAGLGPRIVSAAGISAGQRVLDVAAGSGNAAIPAAENGARVVASDLTPELLAAGRRLATQRGVELDWVEADAEVLPFDDDDFDVVISVVGAMFAPHHQPVADELLRVCRPGGTIAMINWTPEGFVGQLFTMMRPYAPPPPTGAQPAPLWGDEAHVRELFGDRVSGLRLERESISSPPLFARPAELREFYKANYGPTIAVYNAVADRPERLAALDRDFEDFLTRTDQRTPGAPTCHWDFEYLLVTATKN